jgi:glutathione S-transferase
MVTLAAFGPAFGLSDASPFVTKAEILLKMAGVAYAKDASLGAFRKAPKGKLPYIVDDGATVSDSTFIRLYLERKYGFDFDGGLERSQRAMGWAFEKLVEDHLYWAMVYARWVEARNFAIVKAHLLELMPPFVGPLIAIKARRDVRNSLRGHGLGRRSPEEIYELGRRDLVAISEALGDKEFFFGDEPKAVDASLGAFTIAVLCSAFDSPLRSAGEERQNLVAYRDRIVRRFFEVEDAGSTGA